MAELGDVFLTTYSILFGIMLNGALGLGIFHFGYIGKYDQNNVSRRIAVGFILLNIIPFAYFACIFPKFNSTIETTFYRIIGVWFLSLFAFAPYRVFHFLLAVKPIRYWLYHFYTNEKGQERCHKALKHIFKRLTIQMGHSIAGQFISVCFYLLISYIGYLLVFYP